MPRATVFSPATNNGTSAPSPTASRSKLGARQREFPQPVQREQDRRGIGTAAAQAAAQRNALVEGDVDAEPRARRGLQRARGAQREIVVLRHARDVARPRRMTPSSRRVSVTVSARSMQRDQRFQRVVAVRAPSGDVQEQVDLGRRGNGKNHLWAMARAITSSSMVSFIGQRVSVGVGSNVICAVSIRMPAPITRPRGLNTCPNVLRMALMTGNGT